MYAIEALRSFGFEDSKAIRLSGGDINDVFQLDDRVIKVNNHEDFPDMLSLEGEALSMISPYFKTPKVFNSGVNTHYQFLEMEYIPSGSKPVHFWEKFGMQLAHLHQQSDEHFGLNFHNYIGSLLQLNSKKKSWEAFLIQERLQPMVEMAVNAGTLDYKEVNAFEGFYNRINEIIPLEQPTLIHGDLWGGNYLCSSKGEAVLIDPAVYYGHREMDIAMMHLFGGFDTEVFEHYNEAYPLEKGWRGRIKFNQLYPLMVHVNLFGRSYWGQVYNILAQFT